MSADSSKDYIITTPSLLFFDEAILELFHFREGKRAFSLRRGSSSDSHQEAEGQVQCCWPEKSKEEKEGKHLIHQKNLLGHIFLASILTWSFSIIIARSDTQHAQDAGASSANPLLKLHRLRRSAVIAATSNTLLTTINSRSNSPTRTCM